MTIPDIEKQLHAQEGRITQLEFDLRQAHANLAELRKQLGVPHELVECGERRPQFTR